MGEVYEAEDTKLKRRVALKILPSETSADPERRARFEREAQAVAALNHPNIVTIYSVEEAGATPFLTMEFVDGATIDQLLPSAGFPLADLLKYAVPIVDAVAAAHQRGIVHRDLKPANVMVTRDGRVKVLDFGVAKLIDLSAPTNVTTAAGTPAATYAGQIIGTASYMSPEQAEGRPLDHRSDIFSIGTLLYEMATGVRPFGVATGFAVMAAIVRDQPAPMRQIRSGIPPALERIVSSCLEKDPEKRPSSAGDLRHRLDELTAPPRRLDAPIRVGIGAAVVLLAAGGLYLLRHPPSVARELDRGTPTFSRVTYEGGLKVGPGVSSDARELIYAAQADALRFHIYLRRLDGSGTTTDLSSGITAADTTPSFSPDNRFIAFSSSREDSRGIFVMTSAGQGARRLTNGGFDPSWTPDGREIVYSTESGRRTPDARQVPSELWAVNVESGLKRRITGTDALGPGVSPDGRFVAFWAVPVDASGTQFAGVNRDIWIQPMAGGPRIQVTRSESTDWNPAWSADGHFLFFSSDRSGTMNIWRVAIDQATGRPAGEPVAMTAPSSYVSDISVAANGAVAYASYDYNTAIRAVAFDSRSAAVGGPPHDVVSGHREWLQPDVSPDGRFLTMRSFRAQEDVWVVGVDGEGLRRVTNDPARDRGARWARDGSLFFYSSRSGTYQFWTIRADGSGARQLTNQAIALNYPLPS